MTFSYLHPEQAGPTQQQAPQNFTFSGRISDFIADAEYDPPLK